MTAEKFDAYKMVTDRVAEMLENGLIPWVCPWSSVLACAWSHDSGKPYSLMNQILLANPDKKYKTMEEVFADVAGEYITFEQCKKAGGHVKKGEHGRKICFFKVWEKTEEFEKEDGTKETAVNRIPLLKCFTVFKVSQCEGIEQKYHAEEVTHQFPEDLNAEKVAADYISREGITYNPVKGNRAYYAPELDLIVTPEKSQFECAAEYYSTFFHELVHSTGHKSRLNRLTQKAAFGDDVYSTEELVAEIGSASLLATLNIETETSFRNSAGYIQHWLNALRDDKKMFVVAAGRAEKALKLILNINQ